MTAKLAKRSKSGKCVVAVEGPQGRGHSPAPHIIGMVLGNRYVPQQSKWEAPELDRAWKWGSLEVILSRNFGTDTVGIRGGGGGVSATRWKMRIHCPWSGCCTSGWKCKVYSKSVTSNSFSRSTYASTCMLREWWVLASTSCSGPLAFLSRFPGRRLRYGEFTTHRICILKLNGCLLRTVC